MIFLLSQVYLAVWRLKTSLLLFWFCGRTREAVVEGLGLDVAGVACTDGGDKGIKVDANLQTSNKRVYAAGGASE